MTIEAREAQKTLQSLAHIVGRIKDVSERIEHFEELATRVTQSGGRNGSGGRNRSRVEAGVVGMVDLEAKLDNDYKLLVERRDKIWRAIRSMSDEEEKRMIELKYSDGRSWVDVMQRMHISRSSSFRIHERALLSFWIQYNKQINV